MYHTSYDVYDLKKPSNWQFLLHKKNQYVVGPQNLLDQPADLLETFVTAYKYRYMTVWVGEDAFATIFWFYKVYIILSNRAKSLI